MLSASEGQISIREIGGPVGPHCPEVQIAGMVDKHREQIGLRADSASINMAQVSTHTS